MAQHDVAVIGAGLAGLAACIFLRQQGLSVVCLDTHPYPHRKVGESLDWSSPGLLQRLGVSAASLLEDEIATYKKRIVVYEPGKAEWSATPWPPIRRRPLRFETVTLHVNRTALDARLFDRARELGTVFSWERVTGCQTAAGHHVKAR